MDNWLETAQMETLPVGSSSNERQKPGQYFKWMAVGWDKAGEIWTEAGR